MVGLAEYFEQNRYQAKYEFGARVFGHWEKIPFVGTVGSDRVLSDIEGPRLTIQLDLPIKLEGTLHNIIIVKHKDVKRLKDYTEENDDKHTNSKASSKKPVLDSDKRKRKSR